MFKGQKIIPNLKSGRSRRKKLFTILSASTKRIFQHEYFTQEKFARSSEKCQTSSGVRDVFDAFAGKWLLDKFRKIRVRAFKRQLSARLLYALLLAQRSDAKDTFV